LKNIGDLKWVKRLRNKMKRFELFKNKLESNKKTNETSCARITTSILF